MALADPTDLCWTFRPDVHGNVVFGAGISPTTAFNVTTHKLNGEGGHFYVLGDFTPTNAPNLNIAGNFYADNVRLSNASRINVGGKMIVENELRFLNTMIQFTVGQDLLTGSLYTCCTNRIDKGGDWLAAKAAAREAGIRCGWGDGFLTGKDGGRCRLPGNMI